MTAVPFTGNASAVVSGGRAVVSFQATGYTQDISRVTVKQSTMVTNEAQATLYKGQISDAYIVDNTYTGSSGDVTGDAGIHLEQGETIYVVWTAPTGGGIDNGATMIATIAGTQYVPDRGFRAGGR